MPKPPLDPTALRRVAAGRYATGDGRFTAEQTTAGWMLADAEQTDDFGLPLVRGPFGTFQAAAAAMGAARNGPAPSSGLAERAARISRGALKPRRPTAPAKVPLPPRPVIRDVRSTDGPGLRALWDAVDMRSIGDDDVSLVRMARRNPGLLLVATEGGAIVASALGAWDGRRGWIYHVATLPRLRRTGLARDLVGRIEAALRALGAPKVNVIVRERNDEGAAFWQSLGYTRHGAVQFGRELREPTED